MDGGEVDHKKNGEHVAKLANSLLGWRLELAESSPGPFKQQTESTAGATGYKLDDSTSIILDGGERIKFGSVPWKAGLYNCNWRRH